MSEANAVAGKKKPESVKVKMYDGREVEFVGKRKVLKETLVDETKVIYDTDTITLGAGAVAVRMDFLNGETRTMPLPLKLIPKFAGHGGEQKFGDQLAYTSKPGETPPTVEDFVQWIEDLNEQIQAGDWNAIREGGGGVAGASIVVRAISEATQSGAKPKSIREVKDWLNGKLEAAKAAGQKLSRQDLYNSWRVPSTKVGMIIARMEQEQLSKSAKVDADAELAELQAS